MAFKVRMTVNSERAFKVFKMLTDAFGKTMEEVAPLAGAQLAQSLAYSTQPYGDKLESKKAGELAVRRDIERVYVIPSVMYNRIKGRKREDLAKAFYKACREKNINKIREILNSVGETVKSIIIFDGGAEHQAQRVRGKVKKQEPNVLVLDTGAFRKYTRTIQERVGTAKGVWIGAASQIRGSNPRASAWMTRNIKDGQGSGKVEVKDMVVSITLESNLEYAAYILPVPEREKAITIALDKMEKSVAIGLQRKADAAKASV